MDWDVFFFFLGVLLAIGAFFAGMAAFYAFDDDEPKWGALLATVCLVLALATCVSWAAADTPECYDASGYEVSC